MNQSDSIFGGSTQNGDVRHDLDTVQEQWKKEKRRRIRRALVRVVLPLAVLVAYTILAARTPALPGHALFAMHPFSYGGGCCGEDDHDEDDGHDHGQAKPENDTPQPPGTLGFPEAKVRISVVGQLAPKDLMELLLKAVDAKPSEIFLTIVGKDTLPPQQLAAMENDETCGLTLNGKTTYDILDNDGKRKQIHLDGPFAVAYTADDLAIAIMDVHAQQYGKPAWPVFTPISDEAAEQVAERERKIAERQQKRQDDGHGHGEEDSDEPPRQTFDHLPAIREAP